MKVAVLIIHGIGEQKKDYAESFCDRIDDKIILDGHDKDVEVQYFPFEWQHLVESTEENAYKSLPKLGWRWTRNFALTYIGDVIAYQRQLNDVNFYQQVHEALDKQLIEIANWLDRDGRLIIVAHSLGTIIVSNFIWDCQQKNSIGNKFHMATLSAQDALSKLSVLYTIGSPLFIWSLSHSGGGKPIIVSKWKNIYSPNDVIGYPIKTINSDYAQQPIEDICINVGGILKRWNPLSHIAYFDSFKIIKMIVDDIVV